MNLKSDRAFGGRQIRIKEGPDSANHDRKEPLAVGVPLAMLIKRRLIEQPELVVLTEPRSMGAERFRRLCTVLVNQEQNEAQVIVVTSGGPQEGKSTVATNLALAFAAEKNEPTLLIDADLRRPTIGSWLHPAPQLGLSEVLSGLTTPDHAVMGLENSTLKILPAGRPVDAPGELLSSETTQDLIAELRSHYRRIIIDTPPTVPFTDAEIMGGYSDGVLLIARSKVTPLSLHDQAVGSITSTRILGTVLNDVDFNLADADRYHAKQFSHYYDRERKK